MEVCSGTGNLAAIPLRLFQVLLTPDPSQASPVHTNLLSPEPRWVTVNVKPVLQPLRKEKKVVALSLVGSNSPADQNPVAFHCWMLCGRLILEPALCAWEPGLGSRLHSSQQVALSAVLTVSLTCRPWEWCQPLSHPHHSIWS